MAHATGRGHGPVLVVTSTGPLQGTTLTVPEGEHTLGRDDRADLRLPDRHVSRSHARLRREGGTVTLTDDGSTGGTAVNGEHLTGSRVLRHGDRVAFARVEARFEQPAGASLPRAAPALPPAAGSFTLDAQAAEAISNVAGNQYQHYAAYFFGRDRDAHHGDGDMFYLLFVSRGPARLLLGGGLVLIALGVATGASTLVGVLQRVTDGWSTLAVPTTAAVLGPDAAVGAPVAALGAAVGATALVVGLLLTRIGRGLARAARTSNGLEQLAHPPPQRDHRRTREHRPWSSPSVVSRQRRSPTSPGT